ncbi:PepSY domain-containing protein [uncultured Rothia sp.]|uniref:PepSY domain-containing protein n=1 Tax=uncultured Rothia sp. TaxID=316088 RepID=UPI0032177FC5
MKTAFFTSKFLTTLGLGATALLAFTACGSNNEPAPDETTTVTASSSAEGSSASSSASKSSSASSSEAATKSTGDDAVFMAIDAIEKKYPNGAIISIDREDDDTRYKFTVIDGENDIEVHVNQKNEITEEETERADSEDVQEVADSKIIARDALETAVGQADSQSVDDVELNRDFGRLVWEIDFDQENGQDGQQVRVDATSGDVISQ